MILHECRLEQRLGKQLCSFEPMTMMALAGGKSALDIGGSIFGGIFGASSERKRAAAIREAGGRFAEDAGRAIADSTKELRTYGDKATGMLEPFRGYGVGAGNTLTDLLFGGGDVTNVLKASPMFNFQSELGSRNINRELAARGLYGSGAGLETLQRFNNQLVAEEGQRTMDRLFNLTQLGQGAASESARLTQNTGSSLSDIIFRGGMGIAGTRLDTSLQAAGADANARNILTNMGTSLFSKAGEGLMQYGNFAMNKPLIDQSMRMTDGFMTKMGMTTAGDAALAQKHGISY